jgi:hypothetical protein
VSSRRSVILGVDDDHQSPPQRRQPPQKASPPPQSRPQPKPSQKRAGKQPKPLPPSAFRSYDEYLNHFYSLQEDSYYPPPRTPTQLPHFEIPVKIILFVAIAISGYYAFWIFAKEYAFALLGAIQTYTAPIANQTGNVHLSFSTGLDVVVYRYGILPVYSSSFGDLNAIHTGVTAGIILIGVSVWAFVEIRKRRNLQQMV